MTQIVCALEQELPKQAGWKHSICGGHCSLFEQEIEVSIENHKLLKILLFATEEIPLVPLQKWLFSNSDQLSSTQFNYFSSDEITKSLGYQYPISSDISIE